MGKLTRYLVILAMAAAACGSEEATTTTAAAATGPSIQAVSTSLGTVLVDEAGKTLYLFLNDGQGASVCSGDCLANWPALAGPVTAGDGVDPSLLATVARDDGTQQVTYNDWPLYYFAGDSAAGATNGQGIGEVWYVVDPSGEPVK